MTFHALKNALRLAVGIAIIGDAVTLRQLSSCHVRLISGEQVFAVSLGFFEPARPSGGVLFVSMLSFLSPLPLGGRKDGVGSAPIAGNHSNYRQKGNIKIKTMLNAF